MNKPIIKESQIKLRLFYFIQWISDIDHYQRRRMAFRKSRKYARAIYNIIYSVFSEYLSTVLSGEKYVAPKYMATANIKYINIRLKLYGIG